MLCFTDKLCLNERADSLRSNSFYGLDLSNPWDALLDIPFVPVDKQQQTEYSFSFCQDNS